MTKNPTTMRSHLPAIAASISRRWPGTDDRTCRMAVSQVIEALREQVLAGALIYLPGLGTLGTYTSAPRKGRNPRRPEVTIDIPAKTRVYFTAEKQLLATLNEPRHHIADPVA